MCMGGEEKEMESQGKTNRSEGIKEMKGNEG